MKLTTKQSVILAILTVTALLTTFALGVVVSLTWQEKSQVTVADTPMPTETAFPTAVLPTAKSVGQKATVGLATATREWVLSPFEAEATEQKIGFETATAEFVQGPEFQKTVEAEQTGIIERATYMAGPEGQQTVEAFREVINKVASATVDPAEPPSHLPGGTPNPAFLEYLGKKFGPTMDPVTLATYQAEKRATLWPEGEE